MTIAGEAISSAPPDWQNLTAEFHCPLCDYNLRGLIKAQCPECGYEFVWSEILAADTLRHPYLFEHHPRRNIWCYFRTLLGGLLPWRFWRNVKPTHCVNLRRLLIYCLLNIAVLLFAFGAIAARHVYLLSAALQKHKIEKISDWEATASPSQIMQIGSNWGTVQNFIDASHPAFYEPDFLRLAYHSFTLNEPIGFEAPTSDLPQSIAGNAAPGLIAWLAWPWLTLLTLMIFRASMHRAKVKPGHVLRCVIYSCDANWLVGLLLVALLNYSPLPYHYQYSLGASGSILVVAAFAIAILVGFRIACAYRLYLRFPHALAVAIASQLILFLLVLIEVTNT